MVQSEDFDNSIKLAGSAQFKKLCLAGSPQTQAPSITIVIPCSELAGSELADSSQILAGFGKPVNFVS